MSYQNNCDIYDKASIYIHTNDNTTTPIENTSSLKYKVLINETIIAEGTINSKEDKKLATVPLTEKEVTYNFYLYIDSEKATTDFDNTIYSGYIYASAEQTSTLEGQFQIRDLSYNANDATAHGATLNKTDGIITTDGVDDYIDCGLAEYDFKDSISLVARFMWQANNNEENEIIVNYEDAGAGLSIDESGYLFFEIYSNETNSYIINRNQQLLSFKKWYTAVGTYDGTTMNLYLDGNLVSKLNASGTIRPSKAPFYIGANPNVGYPSGEFSQNSYDSVLLYDKTLSSEEINQNFSNTIDSNKIDKDKLLFYYEFK